MEEAAASALYERLQSSIHFGGSGGWEGVDRGVLDGNPWHHEVVRPLIALLGNEEVAYVSGFVEMAEHDWDRVDGRIVVFTATRLVSVIFSASTGRGQHGWTVMPDVYSVHRRAVRSVRAVTSAARNGGIIPDAISVELFVDGSDRPVILPATRQPQWTRDEALIEFIPHLLV